MCDYSVGHTVQGSITPPEQGYWHVNNNDDKTKKPFFSADNISIQVLLPFSTSNEDHEAKNAAVDDCVTTPFDFDGSNSLFLIDTTEPASSAVDGGPIQFDNVSKAKLAKADPFNNRTNWNYFSSTR